MILRTLLLIDNDKTQYSFSCSPVDLWGHCLIAVFITAAMIGYVLSMYSIIKDNFRPWYRWWQNCNDIRLNTERLSPAS